MLESRNWITRKVIVRETFFVKKLGWTSQFHEFFKIFQLCTYARITKCGLHER